MSDAETENAFAGDFLAILEELEDCSPSDEAELAGPWRVLRTEAGFGLYEMWQDTEDKPVAVFEQKTTALKFAAALSAASRDPLFRLDRSRRPAGFPVRSADGREEGTLSLFHERAMELAHMADFCARSPFALAAVLQAAGPATLRKAGHLLIRALQDGGEVAT